uniref:Sperm-associated antigen 6 n=1 Tax=Graphocephala atropunctata TaxID=36148 RepID=A0A1B6L998_9HEMI
MTAKNILQILDQYQKSRSTFAQTVNELASRFQNAEYLVKGNIIELLSPLLSDPVPSIQNNSVMALGRLASHNSDIAFTLAQQGIIPKIIHCLDKKSNYYKKSAMFCLKNIAKHNAELAEIVTNVGGLLAMIYCLESFDSGIKEVAACALANIASHNADLARIVEKAGVVPLLVLCLQEPEICLKQSACLALCEITKHSIDLAQSVVDAHATQALVKLTMLNNVKIKAQVYKTLSHISKHSAELSEAVVRTEMLPRTLLDMGHPDQTVKRNATTLIRDIAKHNVQFAQLIVSSGGIAVLTEILSDKDVRTILPAIVTLGYIAGHSDKFSLALIASGLVPILSNLLNEDIEDHVLAAIVWALGHLGRHSSEHSRHLAEANVFTRLVELMVSEKSSEDLKSKCKATLKFTIQKCTDVSALEPLLHTAPTEIVKYALGQFSKILPTDSRARRQFAASGSLKKIQELQPEPGTSLMEYIITINGCYPEEIIRYYTPNYPDLLLEQLDNYMPQIPNIITPRKKTLDELAEISVSSLVKSDCNC